jgi:cytidine deaminase
MKEITIKIKYKEYEMAELLHDYDNQLIMKARKAAADGYAPYSGFRVGAAVLLGNGKIFTGNNQENAAYPSGLCAERIALFYAAAQFPGVPIIAIAVSTINRTATPSEIAKPCGACRQVMAEYEDLAENPMRIILDSADKIYVLSGMDSLLPFRFKKEDVK